MTTRKSYDQYQNNRSCNYNPGIVTECISSVQNIYNSCTGLSYPIMTPQIMGPLCCPTLCSSSVGQPVMVPGVVPNVFTELHIHPYPYKVEYIQEPFHTASNIINQPGTFSVEELPSQEQNRRNITNKQETSDPFELYLKLPKNLFRNAEMLNLDPNPIIDEFCKIRNIYDTLPWILDLELGVPKISCTRPIAVYDVKRNNIHCKNAPNKIHPEFRKCNKDFKHVLVDYYDFMVNNWYEGYLSLNYPSALEIFQAWLSLPMQMFGMCWP